MALSYKNDSEADERLNPTSEQYDLVNPARELDARETAVLQQLEGGEDNANPEISGSDEDAAATASQDSIDYEPENSSGGPFKQKSANALLRFAKKRGGVIGTLSLLGISGGLMAGFFGPATMLINLMENMTVTNNSSSTVVERRFMKVFNRMVTSDGLCTSKKMSCRMGKMSNNALSRLSKNGITPIFDSGTTNTTGKTGYPSKNPTEYKIDGVDKPVKAKDMPDFLAKKENRRIASKVYGRFGAINMRVRAWTGKYIGKKLYSKFKLSRAGGIASGATSKVSSALSDFKKKIPGSSAISEASSGVKAKMSRHVGKAKKAGVGYLIAAGSCMVLKAPRYVAAAAAAVQLAQILPFVMDIVLSPGSKSKAVGGGSGFSQSNAEATGVILTEKGKRASDGKMTSALDSKYLLAAMGVNKNKVPVSEKFTPGLSIMRNKDIKAATKLNDQAEPACNIILSPAAMYGAAAVDAAATVALSSTIVLGVAKIAASFAIGHLISIAVQELVGSLAKQALTAIASNDFIEKARYEELGDVVGISAAAFFSAGAMSRHIPVLKRTQLTAFADISQDNENLHREMEIASMSPLDTRSRHTFLGSILFNMRAGMINSGQYNSTLASMFSNIMRIPSLALNPSLVASATPGLSEAYCGYASDFDLETVVDGVDNTPAVNMAGLPCTGITDVQDDMSSERAEQLVKDEGWVNDEVEVEDNHTIDDLLLNGYIGDDSPIADFIESCSGTDEEGNPSGDYIFNMAGCTVDEGATDRSKIDSVSGSNDCITSNDTTTCANDIVYDEDGSDIGVGGASGLKDKDSLAAISNVLIDFQIKQALDGNDEDEPPQQSTTISSDGSEQSTPGGGDQPTIIDTPSREGWSHPMPGAPISFGYRAVGSKGIHKGIDFSYGPGKNDGKPVYSAHDGVVSLRYDMGSCGWATVITAEGVNGIWHAYQHMDPIVKVGDVVKRGQKIGVVGKFCGTGKHLHFSIETANRVSAYGDSGASDTSRNPKDYLPL